MTETSCSSFLGSGVSESFCHLAESTLLSHDVISDDFTWPTSDLIDARGLSRKILRSRSTPRASSKS